MALGGSRVAIIGAGVSGLACALELKRNGISPVVFEKTANPGGDPSYLVLLLRIFSDYRSSPVRLLKRAYNIDLSSQNELNSIIMKGPASTVSIKGKLGHIFLKGSKGNSIENQLASSADVDIRFNSFINIADIENDFDHIVVATGDHVIPNGLGLWKQTLQVHTRNAFILGDFKPGRLTMWLNRTYSNSGYAYMVAAGTKSADLALNVTDITMRELDHYWSSFLKGENIKNTIAMTSDTEHLIGYPESSRFGKLYFIGNAGGMLDNFLGTGIARSIESGILAARAIIGRCDFNSAMRPYLSDVRAMGEYRRLLNGLDNEGFDRLLSLIGLPFVKQAIYNNPFFRMRHAAFIPKLLNAMKGQR